MTDRRQPKYHNIHSCTRRLLALALRSEDERVRQHIPNFYTMVCRSKCLVEGDGLELFKAIIAVRNDSFLYTWVREQLAWRMIVDKAVGVLRTLLENVAIEDGRRRIFINAMAKLTEMPINTT